MIHTFAGSRLHFLASFVCFCSVCIEQKHTKDTKNSGADCDSLHTVKGSSSEGGWNREANVWVNHHFSSAPGRHCNYCGRMMGERIETQRPQRFHADHLRVSKKWMSHLHRLGTSPFFVAFAAFCSILFLFCFIEQKHAKDAKNRLAFCDSRHSAKLQIFRVFRGSTL